METLYLIIYILALLYGVAALIYAFIENQKYYLKNIKQSYTETFHPEDLLD
tara:strand:- start:345 stop:497 length:153 start_codon:yes stop_codon:yes gene_type:complete